MEKSRDGYNYGSKLKMSSEHPDNISRLAEREYGNIDSIITSPPYEGSIVDGNENFEGMRHLGTINKENIEKKRKELREYQFGKETTAYGKKVDSIITSPPYEGTLDGTGEGPLVTSKKNPSYKPMPSGYSTDRVDAVITSPPYEQSMGDKHYSPKADRLMQLKRHITAYSGSIRKQLKYEGEARVTPEDTNNIGNLKSASYLSAMLQVYQNCYSVLRNGGLMLLVTKNFIRDKKEVRLDLDMIKLCEQVGFTFQDRWYRELPAQSFWRIIYKQKYPNAPELKYEDVLIFRKGVPSRC